MTTSAGRLARHSAVMAAGSFVSRLLGVVRSVMIMTIFGRSLAGDAWAVANMLPNTIYLLLAGGVLNAVLVPQITKAEKHHEDGGRDFIDRLLTLALLALLVVTVVCVAAAPLLVRIFMDGSSVPEQVALAVSFSYIALPAIFFYGIYTILGQVLNARERFGWYMWSPVLCNIVWIAGLGWFLVHYGRGVGAPSAYSPQMIWLLGGSLLLGVAAQALVLIVPLYRSGFRYTPRFGWRGVGLGSAGRVAMWTFAALVVTQLGLIVQSRVLTSVDEGDTGKLPYDTAFLLFMTPHGLITVSLVTALFTTMSQAASAGDTPALRANVTQGMTLTTIATVPIMIVTLVLGPLLTRVLYPLNSVQTTDAIAYVAMAMMLGLPAFGIYYVLQRGFYAMEDAKAPFYLQVVNTLVAAVVAVGCLWISSEFRAVGVALGQALSNVVAAVLAVVWFAARLEGLPMHGVVRTTVRVLVASIPGMIVAVAALLVAEWAGAGWAVSLAALVIGGGLFMVLYVAAARRMRVRELNAVLDPIMRRLRGVRKDGATPA
ncbi:putative peptidoglycan lipid II flippase [Kineosphaera limosa]|uniref:Uncharacterized protein n=1 Tax=Kineosphaera limosa NBRC 100340 TaxID=1184609 RepID=K6WNP1_9MICO|nr:murein biosynthesis integral membrane protein MurJ [Kineosphaera limosa]NYE01041.1 putative peptidoglycan lipid II flippase [Kineosphaera limosa]GAB95426.1 hypothetical protein KILIM_019_00800 [Kineosphaera limosa NBRC 100340]